MYNIVMHRKHLYKKKVTYIIPSFDDEGEFVAVDAFEKGDFSSFDMSIGGNCDDCCIIDVIQ